MAKIRNVSGLDRNVPYLGRVIGADEVVEINDADLDALVCQVGVWADEATEITTQPPVVDPPVTEPDVEPGPAPVTAPADETPKDNA